MSSLAITTILVFFVAAFGIVGYRRGSFDRGGLVSGLGVVYAILFFGGWESTIIILAFIILASILTRVHYKEKMELGTAQPKGGMRGWQNVLANGGVATAISILEFFTIQVGFEGSLLKVAYIGAIAAATSDTIATEAGILYKGTTRLITKPTKDVSPGASGGVSQFGFLVAFLSSLFIGGLAYLLEFPGRSILIILVAAVGGMIGSTADSFVGATLQRVGRCEVCGAITEEAGHHGKPVRLVRGLSIIDNNVVNVIATVLGAFSAVLFHATTV